jgi:hypothetical protein
VQPLWYRLSSVLLLIGMTTLVPAANARAKKPKAPPPTDEIQVVGHVPLTDGPVKRFLATQHFGSYYLYAEHDSGKNVTLIDVTKTSLPTILADVAYAPANETGSLTVVAGTAALISSEPTTVAPATTPQTVRIMDFSDPRNPKVTREFTGVTAMSRDDRRGLIFISNADGIWILQQHLAEDPEVEKAYAHYVLYSH